ncbi:unnamed protein product [Phytomonas sp. Hart1]|nr:unnamed protein product [Phytomonas sp. Hart1]|eukprot:CCW67925.1 unnamed protein product [Phytomonas sp. isolate Hart1]
MSQDGTTMTDLYIRTTLTLDSSKQHFGPPDAIDYRSHPGAWARDDITIFESMKTTEANPVEDLSIMKSSIYSYKNRKIITQWLRDVCAAFHLKSTTLCLSIQLTDIYLLGNMRTIGIDNCQLAAVACLWVAAKFEEVDTDLPGISKIVGVCDGAYGADQVLDMEESILHMFKWRIPHTTIVNHLYLQIHMISTASLVVLKEVHEKFKQKANSVLVKLLSIDQNHRWIWGSISLDMNATIKEVIPQLCMVDKIPTTSLLEVYQLFGDDFLLAQNLKWNTKIKGLPGDENGEIRLYLSLTTSQMASIFVENDGYTFLRLVNYNFLDLCNFLMQNIVLHVEFLRLRCHVNALGVLGLALCLLGSSELKGKKTIIQHIVKTLKISPTQALAGADLLCMKYVATIASLPPNPSLLTPPEDIRKRLSFCFDRQLP